MDLVTAARDLRYLSDQLVTSPRQARHLARWIATIRKSPLDARLPWLPFDVIDLLDSVVTAQSRVFEFGGGGSTLWFADRAASVVTVEHDPSWARSLTALSPENVTILRRPLEHRGLRYVTSIESFPDDHFDVILVDGRERVLCVHSAIEKVRPGGVILLDDSDRERYGSVHTIMSKWGSRTMRGLAPFKSVVACTTIWYRPE